jgi:hypothetical protein
MRVTVVLIALLVAGCVPLAADPPVYTLSDALWRAAPDCVVVLPAGTAGEVAAQHAERAFARHLSGRIAQVIGPGRRTREARHLGLDLRHPGDRTAYADLVGCRHGAEFRLAGGRSWALIWAEAAIDMEARLLELTTGRVLWEARHRVARQQGGLPISPVGLLIAAGTTGAFVAQADLVPSVLDDGLRALVATLPDLRAGYRVSRNSSVIPLSSRK